MSFATRALPAGAAAALLAALVAPSPQATAATETAAGWRSPLRAGAPSDLTAMARRAAAQGTARVPAAAGPQVVMKGLNNPRQLSLGAGGGLYIAEAGRGGDAACFDGPEGGNCTGSSGSVSFARHPRQTRDAMPRRILKGLLSSAAPDGTFATGSSGVSNDGAGSFYVVMTLLPPEVLPAPLPAEEAGKLLKGTWSPRGRSVAADISAVEFADNPDGGELISNPTAVLAVGRRQLVADAGGNSLIEVDPTHDPHVFAVFPDVAEGVQAVPTSLAKGPDGSVFVGLLGALVPGMGEVRQLSASGAELARWDGFTSVIGVAMGPDGSLYVSEIFGGGGGGQLVKVAPDGTRTSTPVPFPFGVVVDSTGLVFVSAFSVSNEDEPFGPGSSGQVWRMRL